MMTAYSVPPLLAALLNFFLVLWVYRHSDGGPIRRSFMVWSFWQGLWSLSIVIGYSMIEAHHALTWYRWVSSVVVRFLGVFFLQFVVNLTQSEDRPGVHRNLVVAYGFAALFALGGMTPYLVRSVHYFHWGYYPLAGVAEPFFGAVFFATVGYAFHLLWTEFQRSLGMRRHQMKYLLIGATIGWASGATNFLPLLGYSIYPMGNVLNALYSLVVAYVIVEHGFLDVRLVLERGTVYTILSGGLTAVYLSLVALFQRLFGHYGLQENAAFYAAAFPITVLFAPTMKSRLEPWVKHAFFGRSGREAIEGNPAHETGALLGVLATEIAHELSKPLTHIMNERARMETSSGKAAKESLARIEKETQRAIEILDGFALLSPQRPLHRIAYSVVELIEESLSVLGIEEDRHLTISRHFDELPPILLNPGQIVQVFNNVIQNAWQAMPDGGTLALSVRRRFGEAPHSNDHVEITIEDNGPGIPLELQNKVFERFFTTKQQQGGRGVGLAITRAMVKRHNGQILVESPVVGEKGTRIRILIPYLTREVS